MLTTKYRLLLLLLPLLLVISWFQPGVEKRQQQRLTSLHPSEIETIQIRRNSAPLITLQRGESGWMMVQPTPGEANSERIEELLGIVETASHYRFPVVEERLAEYGLKPAKIELQLNTLQLLIGSNEPLKQRRYIKVGDLIDLIDDGFQHHLLAPASAYTALGE